MFKKILFPIDVGDESSWNTAVPIVKEYVKTFSSNLHIITVVPDLGMTMLSQYFPKNAEEKMLEETAARVKRFATENFSNSKKITYKVEQGAVYEKIIDAAKKFKADLIVMSAHRPELKDYLLGPNAAKVVRHSNISVLVVREK